MGTVNLSNTQILLKECITQEFSDSSLFTNESDFFEFFASAQVLKDYDLSDEEIEAGLVGAGGDGGCDSIYLFVNGSLVLQDQMMSFPVIKESIVKFVIIQAKRTLTFNEDTLMKWKTVSDNLLQLANPIENYSARYNEQVLDAFRLFRNVYKKLVRHRVKLIFEYYYVTIADQLHPNVTQQAKELKTTVLSCFPSATVNIEFINADLLFDLFHKESERTINLPLVERPIALDKKKDYVALVNLSTFFRFITDNQGFLMKRLFEANVRDYQGKNSVNSCIQETLLARQSEDFWWLNNGITILASDASLVNSRELQLLNPVIVNGLQTSYEIYNYFSQNEEVLHDEFRNLLVRIIVPESEETRDRVIFATNNQTNIPKATLRVTDPIHFQIEMYFRLHGLYYDRRKNYYKNQGKKAVDIVGVSFLGQCLISIFLKNPDYARARPSTLLNDDEIYKKLYKEIQDLEVFYKCAVIGKRVQNNIRFSSEYSVAEKSDLLFYVLYGVVAGILKKIDITPADIKAFDLDSITESEINLIKSSIFSEYKLSGGNGRVAKNAEFTQKIIKLMQNKFVSKSNNGLDSGKY